MAKETEIGRFFPTSVPTQDATISGVTALIPPAGSDKLLVCASGGDIRWSICAPSADSTYDPSATKGQLLMPEHGSVLIHVGGLEVRVIQASGETSTVDYTWGK